MADGQAAVERIRERHAEAVTATGSYADQHWVEVKLDSLLEICRELKSDPELGYDFLVDVTAAHWPDRDEPMELIYHLYSYARGDRLRVKTRAANEGPVPSVAGIWLSADWNERETYDMFGIRFSGHPDLRRILMPDDYTDYPLRKEFPLYRG